MSLLLLQACKDNCKCSDLDPTHDVYVVLEQGGTLLKDSAALANLKMYYLYEGAQITDPFHFQGSISKEPPRIGDSTFLINVNTYRNPSDKDYYAGLSFLRYVQGLAIRNGGSQTFYIASATVLDSFVVMGQELDNCAGSQHRCHCNEPLIGMMQHGAALSPDAALTTQYARRDVYRLQIQ